MGIISALCTLSMAGDVCTPIASLSMVCGLKAPWRSLEKIFLQAGLLLHSEFKKYQAGILDSRVKVN